MKVRLKRSTKKKIHRFFKKAQRFFLSLLRSAARGLYLCAHQITAFLMRLPVKTLWIGIGSAATVLVLVLVLAIALPGKKPVTASAALENPIDMAGDSRSVIDATVQNEEALAAAADEQVLTAAEALAQAELSSQGGIESGVVTAEANFTAVQKGSDGAVVAQIQSRLMELGYMDSDEPTEHFASLTQAALSAFQLHNDLATDGVCTYTTYTTLMSDTAKIYVMQLGDENDGVQAVQQRLYELSYITDKSKITGTFGEVTEAAVKRFQKKNKLTDDGKVGSKTLELLYSEDAVGVSFSIGDKDDVIKKVQQRLSKLGYYTGKASGEYTRATATAVKKFQSVNNLVVDGQLGPVTKDAILSSAALANVIQLGDSGSDVKKIQTRLAELKYLRSANATGYFGEKTEEAVMAFQSRNKLSADGKIGSGTYSSLFSSSAKKAKTTTSSSSSSSGSSSSGSSSSSSSSGSSSSSSASNSSSSSVSDSKGVEKMIAIAESKLGCKYVSGSKGPNTFDCSGFVYYCLRQAGVNVSYMTSVTWRSTSKFTRISSLSSCKRGDILVFSGNSASTGHVGIYLGSGKMIDAGSSAGCVRKSTTVLSGSYWPSHFLMAYRVF